MNDDPLSRTFASGANQPADKEKNDMIEAMMRDLTGRRHRTSWFLGGVGAVLSLITAGAFATSIAGRGDGAGLWTALLPLALCWGLLLLVGLCHRRHLRDHGAVGRTVPDSIAALLDANRAGRLRLLFVGGAWLVMLPLLLLALDGLQAAGKMAPAHAGQFLALAGGALLLVILGGAAHYRFNLLPEQRRLEALLRDYAG